MNLIEYWKSVSESKKFIHPEDEILLKELSTLVDKDIDIRFPPGPFFGPISTARIILCYANPGIDQESIKTIKSAENCSLLFNQLNGKNDYPYQLEGWHQWFSSRANSLFDKDIEKASKNISVFNLVPYASINMNNVEKIANCLPSVWKAQDHLRHVLIPKAQKNEILLVMCRSSKLWGLQSSIGSKNIIINNVRNGFSDEVKLRVKEWRNEIGI